MATVGMRGLWEAIAATGARDPGSVAEHLPSLKVCAQMGTRLSVHSSLPHSGGVWGSSWYLVSKGWDVTNILPYLSIHHSPL